MPTSARSHRRSPRRNLDDSDPSALDVFELPATDDGEEIELDVSDVLDALEPDVADAEVKYDDLEVATSALAESWAACSSSCSRGN